MPRMTKEQVEAHLARMERVGVNSNAPQFADKGPESRLQGKIIEHATKKGWPILWIRPLRQFRVYEVTPGWPDLSIALPGPRTLWLELKSARGALREKQRDIGQRLTFLGHEWHQIRSFRAYLEVVGG